MGQVLRGLQEKKTTSSWNQKPPSEHPLGLREAGGLRGHLLCEFSFHTDATGRKWFSPKRVH